MNACIHICVYLTFGVIRYIRHTTHGRQTCALRITLSKTLLANQRYVAHFKTPWTQQQQQTDLVTSCFVPTFDYVWYTLPCKSCMLIAQCTRTCRLHILWQTGNYSFCWAYVLCGQIAQDVCSCKKITDRPCTFFSQRHAIVSPLFTTRR